MGGEGGGVTLSLRKLFEHYKTVQLFLKYQRIPSAIMVFPSFLVRIAVYGYWQGCNRHNGVMSRL